MAENPGQSEFQAEIERPMGFKRTRLLLRGPVQQDRSQSPRQAVRSDHENLIAHHLPQHNLQYPADVLPPLPVAAGTVPPPLPPSVEEAYRKKCIELKRRMTEVEESNDAYRLRKARLTRGIRKMRLERAYLLEILGKRMKKNGTSVDTFQGFYDEDSEGSSEGPPTPHEKPLRSKRSHRRPVSSPPPILGYPQARQLAPSQSHPTSAFEPPNHPFRESSFQHVPTTNGHQPMHYQPHPSPYQPSPINPGMAPRPPHPPRPAFDDFIENWIMTRPNEYPVENDHDKLSQVARDAWEDPALTGHRNHFVEKFNSRVQQYERELEMYERDVEHYERERAHFEARERRDQQEMEVERALPPPPPQREGGGFTSING